jgi:hypothetical protein
VVRHWVWVACFTAGCGRQLAIENLPAALATAECEFLVRCAGIESRPVCDESVHPDTGYFASIEVGIGDRSIA